MSGYSATTKEFYEDYGLRDGGILGLGMLFMVVSPCWRPS